MALGAPALGMSGKGSAADICRWFLFMKEALVQYFSSGLNILLVIFRKKCSHLWM